MGALCACRELVDLLNILHILATLLNSFSGYYLTDLADCMLDTKGFVKHNLWLAIKTTLTKNIFKRLVIFCIFVQ